MKRIGVFLSVMMLSLFLLDKVAGYTLSIIFQDTKSGLLGGKINYAIQDTLSYKTAIVGNSRALHHVVPDSFPKAFNFGKGGEGIGYHLGVLKILESQKAIPELVLLHIDARDFFSDSLDQPSRLLKDLDKLSPFYKRVPWLRRTINDLTWTNHVKYFFSSYQYNGMIPSLLKNYFTTKRNPNFKTDGFSPMYASENDSININQAILKLKNNQVESYFSKTAYNLLKEFQTTCQDNGARLICFTAPMLIDPPYREEQYQLTNKITSLRIPYIDYNTNRVSILQKRNLWKNTGHFNAKGAKAFTSILLCDIEKIK